MKRTLRTSSYRCFKTALAMLAIVALTCVAQAAPAPFDEDFTLPIDPVWQTNNYAAGQWTTNGFHYMSALQGGGFNPKIMRNDTGGSGPGSYTHEITVILDTFNLTGGGGTQSDFKWKCFGSAGFMEFVLNSFGDMRIYHDNSTDAVGGSNIQPNTNIGLASGTNTLKIVKSYDDVTDTIDVKYSVNGAPLVAFYNGTGTSGSIGDVITSFVEVEVFKWGAAVETPLVLLDEWKLITDTILIAIDDPDYEATTGLLFSPTNGVLDNDTYTGSLPLSADLVSSTSDGSLTLNADGTFDYTSDIGFTGDDSFTYKAFTLEQTSDVATVTISVIDPEAIVAVDDDAAVETGVTLTNNVSVLDNDEYTGALTLSADLVSTTTDGSLTLYADGTYEYTSDNGFVGEDTFTYEASTSARTSNVATVTIFVYDPEGITANDDAYDAYDGVELVIDAPGVMSNDGYGGTNALSSYEVSGPANGVLSLSTDGSFTYTANAAFIGDDTFTYEVHSSIRTSNVATVTLTVSDVEASLAVNPDSYAGAVDEVLSVSAGAGVLSNDEYAGASLSAQLLTTTTNGVLSLSADGSFTYTPGAAFIGFDGFTYEAVTSGGTTSAPVTVTLETADPSVVNILFQPLVAGNGVSAISAVATQGEVALPISIDFNNGSAAGDQWGGAGLVIGGSAVTFTTTQITSFSGTVYTVTNGSPTFSAPNEGLGVDSGDGGKIWMIDGSESFTWQADKDLVFEGIGLRAGFDGNQNERSFSISSSDWAGLTVSPGIGITYTDTGTEGVFTIQNVPGNVVGSDNDLTAEEMVGVGGPALAITAASEITFASLNGPSVSIDNFSIEYAAFSAEFTAPAVVLAITADGTDVIVSWDGVSGGSYTLQSKAALTDAWGGDITGFVGAGPHSVTNTAIGAEFYQVITE